VTTGTDAKEAVVVPAVSVASVMATGGETTRRAVVLPVDSSQVSVVVSDVALVVAALLLLLLKCLVLLRQGKNYCYKKVVVVFGLIEFGAW
jgi:hypothetical protein